MILTYESGAFIADCPYEEKDIPKKADFIWHKIVPKKWATHDPKIAAKLAKYADEKAGPALAKVTEERERNLELSRAEDLDIDLPRPDGLEYMPFQKAGIAYASNKNAVLLGDDMGLGKTVQAIGYININPDIRSALVICPASLKINWQRELTKWLVREYTISIADTKTGIPDTDIVIINYDILHKLNAHEFDWDLIVADEAHNFKNEKTQRARAIRGHRAKDKETGKLEWKRQPIPARRKLALTGTPIPNKPIEIWPILNWLDPGAWPSYFMFGKQYCNAHKGTFGWVWDGSSNLPELQDKLRSTIMVRRKKEDVLKELPPKRRRVIPLPANGSVKEIARELELYQAHKDRILEARADLDLARAGEDQAIYKLAVLRLREAQGVMFTEMARLRATSALLKAPHVASYTKDILNGTDQDYKIIIFAHHTAVIDLLMEELADYGAVKLTGSCSMTSRQESVDRFQNDPTVRVFIGNMKAAGVGITLTASAHEIFAEEDWVPATISQAEDRAARIGQVSSVLIEHLVFEESLDAKMARTVIKKQEVIDDALDVIHIVEDEDEIVVDSIEEEDAEATERPAIERKLIQLTQDAIDAVVEALAILSGSDADFAAAKNDMGFNRYDSRIGHSLAQLPHLTHSQAALGYRIVKKYHRQLPDSIKEVLAL